jgi:hypothetical protein
MLRRIGRFLANEFDPHKAMIALPCLVIAGLALLFGIDPPGGRPSRDRMEAIAAGIIILVGLFAMYHVVRHGAPPERDD